MHEDIYLFTTTKQPIKIKIIIRNKGMGEAKMRIKIRRKKVRGRVIGYEITIPKNIIETIFPNIEYMELRVEARNGKQVIILEPINE